MSPILRRYFILLTIITLISLVIYIKNILQYEYINYDELFVTKYNENDLNDNLLVNLTNFNYTINSKICDEFDDEILALIIITSYVGHDNLRSAHRQAMSSVRLRSMGMLRLFLLAEIPDHERFITQSAIENENKRFNDLLQGNFIEAYRNLTYKHTMGLKWSVKECSQAKFIVKMDDDTVFDVYYLKDYLEKLELYTDDTFLAGYVLNGKKPIRVSASKWYVPSEEYSKVVYPDYLSGWLYITNPVTAKQLIFEAQHESYFWIDDTWITGILREKTNSIQLQSLNKLYSANSQFIDCCINDIKRWNFKCDYVIGPNGGDNDLILKFTKAIDRCYSISDDADDNQMQNEQINECLDRTPEHKLTRTCIGKIKDIIEDHGMPIIEPMHL